MAIGKCACCNGLSFTIKERRLNTKFYDDERNKITSCNDCFEEQWKYYEERWAEYYNGIMYINPERIDEE